MRVGVVGRAGYTGVELLRLLAARRYVEVSATEARALDQLAVVP